MDGGSSRNSRRIRRRTVVVGPADATVTTVTAHLRRLWIDHVIFLVMTFLLATTTFTACRRLRGGDNVGRHFFSGITPWYWHRHWCLPLQLLGTPLPSVNALTSRRISSDTRRGGGGGPSALPPAVGGMDRNNGNAQQKTWAAATTSSRLWTAARRATATTTTTTTTPTNANTTTTIGTGSGQETAAITASSTTATGPAAVDTDDDWRCRPSIRRTLVFPTLLVPAETVHRYIREPALQPFLARPENNGNVNNGAVVAGSVLLRHVHPRIKLVLEYNDDTNNTTNNNNNTDASNGTTTTTTSATHKLILLLPPLDETDAAAEIMRSERDKVIDSLIAGSGPVIGHGPPASVFLDHKRWSLSYLLGELLPPELAPHPTAYEQIGHVAHFNLKPGHVPYGSIIGQALLGTNPTIHTVVNKVGHVSGKYRTYRYEVMASKSSSDGDGNGNGNGNDDISLETTVVEDGVVIRLNVAECYWCTRLSGERQELVREILPGRTGTAGGGGGAAGGATTAAAAVGRQQRRKELPLPPLSSTSSASASQPSTQLLLSRPPVVVVADVFCGVGAVCLLLAKKGGGPPNDGGSVGPSMRQPTSRAGGGSGTITPAAPLGGSGGGVRIIANDWNPKAIGYFRESIRANGLDESQFQLTCTDAYDFLIALGDGDSHGDVDTAKGSGGRGGPMLPSPPRQLPDHVLMNYPLEAPKFLGALRWWSWERLEEQQSRPFGTRGGGRAYPRFHVYTFARSAAGSNNEEEVAVDIVANELMPNTMPANKRQEPDVQQHRRQELDDEFDANVSTRLVRDVAPGKVVVCVSFSVTPKLIRYMQGDYF